MGYNIVTSIRGDQLDKRGEAVIFVSIYEGKRRVGKKSLGNKVLPTQWDYDKQRVKKSHPNSTLLNSLIAREVAAIEKKLLEDEAVHGQVVISDILASDRTKGQSFYEFAEKQIAQKNYAAQTRRTYGVYLEKMKAYRPRLWLSDINYQFLQGYEAHLRDELGNTANTVWSNLKFINTITNDAIKCKHLISDPFKVYARPKYKQTKRTFLTPGELANIESYEEGATDTSLRTVANYFLFMAYTGLRFSDAIRFKVEAHVVNGERIVMETQKTKQPTNLFINDKVRRYAWYVDANPLTISGVDFNRKLKIIAAACGIDKKVSSHVARHSFGASLVTLGVPEKVAQGLLAHGSAASTRIYYHLDSPALDEAMKRFK
jgi:integrase/recombinase XerD